ncbi:MAG TPA: DUF4105 domain-containing protein [Candidatus Pacebacteria bacterium]|nr:DUF4105 domain-containing protein [Candidatus Paceibacterota bacterium]
MKKILIVGISIVIFCVICFFVFATRTPSNNRIWEAGHDKLPHIQIKGNNITITNLRDFTWQEDGSSDNKYLVEYFDLSKMNSLDVVISHFDDFAGLAHVFITFGFEDGRHIVISVETRRETHEEFSPWTGLLNKFELIYVVGTERDIIGTRTDVRGERVYLYNIDADKEIVQGLFQLIAQDVNAIYDNPVFYNTLKYNCINAITRRAEEVADIDFPFSYKMLLPGFVDEILYEMDIIVKKGTFKETKIKAEIDNDAVDRNSEDFSQQIRTNFKSK